VDISALLRDNPVFEGLSHAELQQVLAAALKGVRRLRAGEDLIREGSAPSELYLIGSGSFEVRKREADGIVSHGLAVLGPGMCLGEAALLDPGPRSAAVVALQASEVFVFDVAALEALPAPPPGALTTIKVNLARDLARKFRVTNELAVDHLRKLLAEAQLRVEMGRFIARMLFGISIYVFGMPLAGALARNVLNTSFITTPIALVLAFFFFRTIQTSPLPLAAYGFTLAGWRRKTAEAIALSIPIIALIIGVKALVIEFMPSMQGRPLLDLGAASGLSAGALVLYAVLYAIVTPVQEACARGGIQGSLQMFLTGRHRILQAIVLSNLMFSLVHIHMSVLYAAMVFPVGLFWGWLFHRHGSLVSVSVSHALIGVVALFVVGVEAVF
jgi:CRP-like cAMP-binding protein